MYQSFMKKVNAQLAFLKVKSPTTMAFQNYLQESVSPVTQVHGKIERLLLYFHSNFRLEGEDLSFCFEEGCNFTCPEKKELISLLF